MDALLALDRRDSIVRPSSILWTIARLHIITDSMHVSIPRLDDGEPSRDHPADEQTVNDTSTR